MSARQQCTHTLAFIAVHSCLVMACAMLDPWQGLPVLRAPGEAEATAAALSRAGNVDAVASRDGDALLFGAQTVLKEAKLHVRAFALKLFAEDRRCY